MFAEIAAIIWGLQGLDPEETMWGYDLEQFAEYLEKEMSQS